MKTKSVGTGVGAVVVLFVLLWWAIGPDWRAVVRVKPVGVGVYALTDEQRDVAFRMADRVPFFVKTRSIEAGNNVRVLPRGDDLNIEMDVDAFLKSLRTAGFVIVHKGKVRKEFYDLGFGPHKRWISASVNKSFISTLLGAAIEDGLIASVDQPITDFIPELKGSGYDGATLEHLLMMSSGVQWREAYGAPDSEVTKYHSLRSPGAGKDLQEGQSLLVDLMESLPRLHPPGEHYNYNSGESHLIALAVRRAVDKPLATYFSEKIWKPFGMEDDANWFLRADGEEHGGVMATTKDYARFGVFIIEQLKGIGDRVVAPDYLERATSYQLKTPYGWGYGYQWWVSEPGDFSDPVFIADGVFGQSIFVDPKRDLVIAANRSWSKPEGVNGQWEARQKLWKAVQAAIDKETNFGS
ncbi:MAG: serine hydrolase [Pseudomonadota bacterium]